MERVGNHREGWREGGLAWIGAAVLVFLILMLRAPDAVADKFNTETSSSAEALGMGDAAINVSRGPQSVFYNPANIASKTTKTTIQAVNFQLDSDGLSPALGAIQSLNDLYKNTLKGSPGTFVGSRYNLYPNATFNNFSFGMLYEVNRGAYVRTTDNTLVVQDRDRFAPTAAVSLRLFSGVLRLGADVQYVTVGSPKVDRTVDSSSPNGAVPSGAVNWEDFINAGSGISKNFGATLTLPIRFLPSFSLVARDIGNTRYTGAPLIRFGSGRNPAQEPMTYDLAGSMTVYLARRLEMRSELDFRDVLNRIGGNRFRHVFLGSELVFFDFLRVRAGLMHGYPTAGVGIGTPRASLDLSMYSEELYDKLRGRADDRIVLQYTWGMLK